MSFSEGHSDGLIGAAQRGDESAFAELVAATHRRTYLLAYRLMGNPHDAADVVQEAYLRAYRALEGFRGDASFDTWLYRITANCASTHLGRRRRDRCEVLDDDDARPAEVAEEDPQLRMDHSELSAPLADAIDQLPLSLRTVVVLRDVYDLSHADISEELSISVTAAKVRLHRGRKRLRELLAASAEAEMVGTETAETDAAEESGRRVAVIGGDDAEPEDGMRRAV